MNRQMRLDRNNEAISAGALLWVHRCHDCKSEYASTRSAGKTTCPLCGVHNSGSGSDGVAAAPFREADAPWQGIPSRLPATEIPPHPENQPRGMTLPFVPIYCPNCKDQGRDRTYRTMQLATVIRRYHRCERCGMRWATVEVRDK